MDRVTTWMVRGGCGSVILSEGISFGYGVFAVVRGKQLMREVAVRTAELGAGEKCSSRRFRFSYPEVSPKVRDAAAACQRDVGKSVPLWWSFKSPLEIFLFSYASPKPILAIRTGLELQSPLALGQMH